MQKTYDQLQAALERELAYTQKLNSQIDRLREQLRNTISIQGHKKALAVVRQEYENEMAEIKSRQSVVYNPRGAGHKKKATEQMIMRVQELRTAGFSQQVIANAVSKEFGIAISRTTVGEIVRGEHKE